MTKLYKYIENSNIYAIFDKSRNVYIISTNPNARAGVILII